MQNYYKAEYNADTICIPYGGDIEPDYNTDILEHYELIPQNYLLFVGRLEPENNAHILIEAFKQIPDKRGFKLVIVGDAPYASSYKDYLRKLSSDDKTITFTGYLFGDGYRQLSTHAYLFILPSEVGGTHPVLTQQMFIGNCIVAAKTDSNTEVLNNCGFLFDLDEPVVNLKNIILYLIQNPNVVNEYKKRAKEYARGFYSWDRIAKQYIELFQNEFGE